MTLKTGLLVLPIFMLIACTKSPYQRVEIQDQQLVISKDGKEYLFDPNFTIIYSEKDPNLAMRPAGIAHVRYNVATWEVYKGKSADLKATQRSESTAGDGFDSRILEGKSDKRSPNPYNAGVVINMTAKSLEKEGNVITLHFEEHDLFDLKATITAGEDKFTKLRYELEVKKDGFFSVGYTGAPAYSLDQVEEIWQPLIWQDKRFPENAVMTLAFRAPLPTTMVYDGKITLGVMASPEEFPFEPLPVVKNSRFGIMVRNQKGKAQPQLFAPVPGGIESSMKAGDTFHFASYLVMEKGSTHQAYEALARDYFGFKDIRHNEISSLNETFEHIVEYAMSENAWFVDSLKGCAYSTDVPGAVKNVSSLNALELAIVMDDSLIFEERAYPIIEYMLSREKFLFSLDPEQKIQHPSRKLAGPIAPVSELASLYNILDQQNPFLVEMAKKEYQKTRIRNLDVAESGENWINSMYLYKATGEQVYLEKAKTGADKYIESRIKEEQTSFEDPYAGGFFFWTAFAPKWIELMQLYEITEDKRYLEAAQEGARFYTMFTWMSPKIPDTTILVNKDGKAPMYWYLKAKGHKQMYFPEEEVEAWRLSEIGLTPESSGTSTGHRAIFMANYAPWMLRLGYYANDDFLKEVAKAAIIGRYKNFPGYHINTARTTAYEKENYPYHKHKELSVNSFHYNHILPMASMLLDYLVTDVFVRSEGQIDFPAEYIEGYAYLQNKFYGSETGKFYDEEGVQLWMPKDLLEVGNVELNYIAAYKDNKLYLAFTNQSGDDVKASVKVNKKLLEGHDIKLRYWKDNEKSNVVDSETLSLEVEVSADGITAVVLEGVRIKADFQKEILSSDVAFKNSYQELPFGNARAMVINLGTYGQRAYVYLQDDDAVFSSASLVYKDDRGKEVEIKDSNYPYEFTVPLKDGQDSFSFRLQARDLKGNKTQSGQYRLGN